MRGAWLAIAKGGFQRGATAFMMPRGFRYPGPMILKRLAMRWQDPADVPGMDQGKRCQIVP